MLLAIDAGNTNLVFALAIDQGKDEVGVTGIDRKQHGRRLRA